MEALMTIEELHRTVVDGFRKNDEQFAGIDARFGGVDDRFVSIEKRFARIDERFDRVDAECVKVRQEMRGYHDVLEARILEQSETMRRHVDVMVEKVEAAVRIVAEGHVHLRTVLDNHEVRLQAIEKHE
jgi:hypothetical protein